MIESVEKREYVSIAIDGPAGAGKSTIAKKVAGILGYVYMDTGAMYRAAAYGCIEKGIDISDEKRVSEYVENFDLRIKRVDGIQNIYLDGRDVSGSIRMPEVSGAASVIAAYGAVRQKLVKLQKDFAKSENIVMDGRDIGTCVLPDAPVKIYLTASVKVRADRRYKELLEKGVEKDLAEIERDIEQRDHNDMNRAISPLRKAEDAAEIDSSDMSIAEVAEKILSITREKISLLRNGD